MRIVPFVLVAALVGGPHPVAPRATPVAPDPLMVPGISRELAVRRAEQIKNVRYDLTLDVTRRDTAYGAVKIRFDLARPGDAIVDFRGPTLANTRVNGAAAAVEFNGAHIRVPAAPLKAGENTLEFDFRALIAPSGASIIRFHDATDGKDYLYTLLVPADANQLFPCFDQPDLKARVTLNLVTPVGWSALANGVPPDSVVAPHVNPTLRWQFRETEPISTYLIAFAAGPWKILTSEKSRKPVHLYVRASRAKEAEGDSIILANDRAATWLEQYFATPFPFAKLDVLLAPAFPFGGMEHPGAIFYNEERFIFRERPTLSQRLGRTATIDHEVAHQWFGDLVTMKWFDDLWLKEGFATYMAAKMQDAMDPKSEAWKTFYLRNKPVAYGVDVTSGTTPIWQELANLDQAKSNYGAIVYNKAPGVLKQLNYLVGDDAFRDGLRRYLRAHAYGNATWRDLLDAVGAAGARSLGDWGKQYILRPGMPVLEQQVSVSGETISRLALIQHPARTLSGHGAWPIRTELLLYYDDAAPVRIPVTVGAETTVVRAAAGKREPSFVFANAGDFAYALVLPDPRSAAWLERHIGSVKDSFLRAMLWGAMWDLVREARFAPDRFISLVLRELPAERDEQLVSSMVGRATRAGVAYLSPAARDSLVPLMEHAFRAGEENAELPYGIRKPQLDALIRIARAPATLAYLDSVLDQKTAIGEPLRPPTRWAIVTRLLEVGAPTAERRYAAEQRADSGSEGKRRAFVAGAARPSAEVKRAYFDRYFHDAELNEDWVTASLDAFNTLEQQSLTRPYLIPALDTLPWIQQNRRIFFLGSWLSAFLDGQANAPALDAVERWLAEHKEQPRDLRQKVSQASDELERTVRIRRTFGGAASVEGGGSAQR